MEICRKTEKKKTDFLPTPDKVVEFEEAFVESLVEAILEADAEEADKVVEIEEAFVESIVEAIPEADAGEIFRIKAASRHTIVFRPGNY